MADPLKQFIERGFAAQSAVDELVKRRDDDSLLDPDLVRNLLQAAILGEQAHIECTNEDDTRLRAKSLLQVLQRLNRHMEAVMGRLGR